ncbi:MAG: hypothetical protein V1646_03705 [bacterium]
MIKNKTKQLVFVVYDGIDNSVFHSQVLKPILDEINQNEELHVTFVCFEKHIPKQEDTVKIFGQNERLKTIFLHRYPFLGKLSLMPAISCLTSLLKTLNFDQITARGPLAGYVTLQTLSKMKHFDIPVVIQARGLCAQEYRYANPKEMSSNVKNLGVKLLWDKLIFKSLQKIEKSVYKAQTSDAFNLKIEAVSLALKDYLIQEFGADPVKIIIAINDIPKTIDKYQVVVWRTQVRDELAIPDDYTVYCYSGSFKPWQCAKETIESFAFQYFKDPKSFMLVLTQDQEPFENELKRFNIPKSNYIIKNVNPQELHRYMCAANFGFLLREPDVINWVSRPTKMLEYQACGLHIIHNNTVAWLAKP